MKRWGALLLAGALATGLIAAGCGGGDDDNGDDNGATTAAETLSKSEFVQEANQICKEGNDELDQAGQSLGQSSNEEDLKTFITETLVPNIQGQIDQIRALGIPEADQEEVNAILDDAEADLSKVKDDPSIVIQNQDPFTDVNKRLDDYGLTECASN
jgi:hypothetical protein